MNFIRKFLYIFILLVIAGCLGEVRAQETTASPTPTPTPTAIQTPNDTQKVQPENLQGVPRIAPNYESADRNLPDLGRVGVDMTAQRPLSMREAIAMALENNKDIEVARDNTRIAEFDLQAARGFYEPRLTGQTFYERATVPNISFFTPQVTK